MTTKPNTTTLTHWLRFNLVGLLGMAVQLTLLALFNHLLHGRHILLATTAAIELTLLHNFVWHLRYTWRNHNPMSCHSVAKRRNLHLGLEGTSKATLSKLLKFHLSNGLVSLIGNLALMSLLTRHTHVPLLAANLIAIVSCSAANFLISHRWTFIGSDEAYRVESRRVAKRSVRLTLAMLSLLAFANISQAQQPATSQSQSTEVAQPPAGQDTGLDCAYENVFVGPAVSVGGADVRPTFTAGVTLGTYAARPGTVRIAQAFELGIIGPLPGGYFLDGLVSYNLTFATKVPRRALIPIVTAGYTRLFVTGNAVNFGFGIDLGSKEGDRAKRIEIRDYFLFTGPVQHVIGLRFAWGRFLAD